MTDHAPDTIVGLTELKTVIGNLWKKVDTFQNSAKSDTEHLNQQVAEWTQTNLILLRLLADLSEETTSFGKASTELVQTSTHLATAVSTLPTSLEELKVLLQQNLHKNRGSGNPQLAQQTEKLQAIHNQLTQKDENLRAIRNKLTQLEKEISKAKKSEGKVSLSAQVPRSKDVSIGVITISYVLLSVLNLWIGWQLRIWQISSDPSYKIGQSLVQWNADQIHRARQNNQPKSTLWIVPPHAR